MAKPAAQKKGATYAVLGYVSDDVAKSLAGQETHGRALEVRIDRGNDQEIVRIPADAVAGVLQGASQGGETSVQVLLKDKAQVETVTRGLASDLHLRAIGDKGLVFKLPPYNVIYVQPELTGSLLNLTKKPG